MNDLNLALRSATPAIVSRNARRYALYGALFGLAIPILATIASLALARMPWTLGNLLALHIGQPPMWIIDTAPLFLGVFAALAGWQQDAAENANLQFRQQAHEMSAIRRTLEQRVTERTQELEERNRLLRSAVQATRTISQVREAAELSELAVQLIAHSFGDFVVDLYILDERRSEAVLRASSGAQGKAADSVGGAVRVGDPSLVGQVAASGEAGRVLSGAAVAEIALPLLARGLPLGVLHIRPADSSVALPADTELLQLVADQLASAIETARSFGQARDALEQLQAVSGQAMHSAWKEQLRESTAAYEYTPAGIRTAPLGAGTADPRSLRVPLELRGRRIGTIALTRRTAEGWTDSDRDLAEKTAAQVALALENVRLLQDTRERALQEQRLSEFSARLNQSVDLDTLLQTAVRELATLPEVADASIYLNPAAPVVGQQPTSQDARLE